MIFRFSKCLATVATAALLLTPGLMRSQEARAATEKTSSTTPPIGLTGNSTQGVMTYFICKKGTAATGCKFTGHQYTAGTVTIGFTGNSARKYFDVTLRDSKGTCSTGGSTATSKSVKCTGRKVGNYTMTMVSKDKLVNDVHFSITEP